jgi:hypothetical protein
VLQALFNHTDPFQLVVQKHSRTFTCQFLLQCAG